MVYYVYIIYSESHDKYYIGQTSDFAERIRRHNKGLEKFTSPYCPWTRICVIEKSNRSEAVKLEKKLKNLNRIKLIISGGLLLISPGSVRFYSFTAFLNSRFWKRPFTKRRVSSFMPYILLPQFLSGRWLSV